MEINNTSLIGIGNTPLVKLNNIVPENSAEVWIKLEGVNPTGSYKDRVAISVLNKAMERGDISRGDTVVEYTGGSTGTSLAYVSAVLGLTFVAVFSDAFSKSKQQSMKFFRNQNVKGSFQKNKTIGSSLELPSLTKKLTPHSQLEHRSRAG